MDYSCNICIVRQTLSHTTFKLNPHGWFLVLNESNWNIAFFSILAAEINAALITLHQQCPTITVIKTVIMIFDIPQIIWCGLLATKALHTSEPVHQTSYKEPTYYFQAEIEGKGSQSKQRKHAHSQNYINIRLHFSITSTKDK